MTRDHVSSHTKFALAEEHIHRDKLRPAFKELNQNRPNKKKYIIPTMKTPKTDKDKACQFVITLQKFHDSFSDSWHNKDLKL